MEKTMQINHRHQETGENGIQEIGIQKERRIQIEGKDHQERATVIPAEVAATAEVATAGESGTHIHIQEKGENETPCQS